MNAPHPSVWIERLTLTDFRNYAHLTLEAGPGPVVLYGANGAGKTNLLEAVSMLSPGQGLRRATFIEMARHGGGGEWIVAARINRHGLAMDVGTGLRRASRTRGPMLASCASTAIRCRLSSNRP